jgi:hypothetical protein
MSQRQPRTPLSVTPAASARLEGREDALRGLLERLDQGVSEAGWVLAGASVTAAVSHDSPTHDVVLELAVEGRPGERECIELWGSLSDLVERETNDPWIEEKLALVVRTA